MSYWSSLWFQDAHSLSIDIVDVFHDYVIVILVSIVCTLALFIIDYIACSFTSYTIVESQVVELTWTVLPSIVLIVIALPSLRVLYLIEENATPYLSLKVLASQWWWNYEYSNYDTLTVESYLSINDSLGDLRLLEVDNRPVIPTGKPVRVLVSSSDVLHSWCLPSIGIKLDANPGRVNQLLLSTLLSSTSYGSCTEICGANHSFIPIAIDIVPPSQFRKWVLSSIS